MVHLRGLLIDMSKIVEIVFDGICSSQLPNVIDYFIMNSSFSNTSEVFFEGKKEIISDFVNLKKVLLYQDFSKALLKLLFLNIGSDKLIMKVNVWIYLNKSNFDLEIDFDLDEIADVTRLVEDLYCFANQFAKLFHINLFYSGLEPAYDEDTRFFTNQMIGPLKSI